MGTTQWKQGLRNSHPTSGDDHHDEGECGQTLRVQENPELDCSSREEGGNDTRQKHQQTYRPRSSLPVLQVCKERNKREKRINVDHILY